VGHRGPRDGRPPAHANRGVNVPRSPFHARSAAVLKLLAHQLFQLLPLLGREYVHDLLQRFFLQLLVEFAMSNAYRTETKYGGL
jgi:hypothetical protein